MEMLLKDGLEELGYPEGKNMTFHPILPASGTAKHKSLISYEGRTKHKSVFNKYVLNTFF